MTRSLLPAFFIVVGPDERLVIVADALGIPGAKRYRTRQHAQDWLDKHEPSELRAMFGPEATV